MTSVPRRHPIRFLVRLSVVLMVLAILAGVGGTGAVLWGMHHYGRGLPDYGQLAV